MAYKTMAYRRGAWHTYGLHRKPCETQPNGLKGEPVMVDRQWNLPDQTAPLEPSAQVRLNKNLYLKMMLKL